MEIVDTEFGKLPPRTNFVLFEADKDQSGCAEDKILYGVHDIINILKINKEEAKIEEFLFIIRKQGEAIKEKINEKIAENSMPVENIIDMLPKRVLGPVDKNRFENIIKTFGRYRLDIKLVSDSPSIQLKNFISYRLHPNIVKSIRRPVKSLILRLDAMYNRLTKLKEIKNDDGYKDAVIIKNGINAMVSTFFQNTIFELTLEEQYEYLVTCFPRLYTDSEECHSSFGTYVEGIVQRVINRYSDYYDNQRIMLSSVVKGKPYIRRLRAGTMIYRGSPHSSVKRNSVPTFLYFTHNPFVALLYAIPKTMQDDLGLVSVYQVQTDLRILDFSNYHTVDFIISLLISLNAPNNVIKAIVSGWFNEGQRWMNSYEGKKLDNRNATKSHSEIKRHSDTGYDFVVSEWLCSNGFNGYIGLDVKKQNGQVFHDEFMICNPSNENKVKYLGVLDKEYINYNLEVSQTDWYQNILQ